METLSGLSRRFASEVLKMFFLRHILRIRKQN